MRPTRTLKLLAVAAMSASLITLSACPFHGSASGYFISPESWIFFETARSSSKVVGGVRPSLSNTSLR